MGNLKCFFFSIFLCRAEIFLEMLKLLETLTQATCPELFRLRGEWDNVASIPCGYRCCLTLKLVTIFLCLTKRLMSEKNTILRKKKGELYLLLSAKNS